MVPNILKAIKSFQYAFNGLIYLFKHENNFKIHVWAAIFVVGIGIWMQFSNTEWIAIIFCMGIVLISEGFNSAIEKTIDLISPEFNTKVGLAKDISAAAVLLASIMAIIIGIIIILNHI